MKNLKKDTPCDKVTSQKFANQDRTAQIDFNKYNNLRKAILRKLSSPADKRESLKEILLLIKEFSDCETVGICIKQGEIYQNYATDDFVQGTEKSENYLCISNNDSQTIQNFNENSAWEYIRSNVINGVFDPTLPFYTEGGSFWTNSLTNTLASLTAKEVSKCTGNSHNIEGYESVVLIPLKGAKANLGLLQLHDTKSSRFSAEIIDFYEDIGQIIGIAYSEKAAVDRLQTSKNEMSHLLNNMSEAFALFESIFDEHGDIVNCRFVCINDAFEHITSMIRKDVENMTLYEVWAPIAADLINNCSRVATTGMPSSFEIYDNTVSTLYSCRIYNPGNSKNLFCMLLKDSTDRRKTDDLLSENIGMLRRYIDETPDGIYMLDTDGNFLYCNHRYEEMLGYNHKELIGKNIRDIDMLQEKCVNKLNNLFSENQECIFSGPDELDIVKKDGQLISVEVTNRIIKRREKCVVLCFVRDITEYKHIKKYQQITEAKYLNLVENISEGIIVIQDDKIVFVNKNACELVGCSIDEVIQTSIAEYIHIEDRDVFIKEHLQQLKSDAYLETHPIRMIDKHGFATWVLINSITINWEDKSAILSLVNDISDRKLLQSALAAKHIAYNNTIENVPIGIFYSTVDGKLTTANRGMAMILGYNSPSELITTVNLSNIGEVVFADPTVADEILHDIIEQQGWTRHEVYWQTKDHTFVVCILNSHAIRNNNGEINCIENFAQNITELKQTEQSLEKTNVTLTKIMDGSVATMSAMVEMRDPYTAGHQMRVAELSEALAKQINLPPDMIHYLVIAASLHDIGKISVPTEILSKPGKLSEIEFNMIKTHALAGYNIVKGIKFPWPVSKIVAQHHERLDGSGYPYGLKYGNIMLEARILAVADVVEAMASHRPYRAALGIDKAMEEISTNKGKLYDPIVVDVCLELFNEKKFKFR